ncbi:antitoxin Xre/MbcA/ParS toxin-binding domain-containing protein [Pseudomonas moraviensis]|uniref:antitoxin Xre/MbcA/ParS toxin-binding domain-containing protein n=1 Tax=Pseudomonas moraviensis TaxID=321662 RepID=UPI00380EDB6C
MAPSIANRAVLTALDRKPTEHLTHARIEELSELHVFLLVREGFELTDVQAMIALSELYSSSKLIERITGKPSRPKQGKVAESTTGRLSPIQSAIAFQYAKVLEHATTVFGTLRLAEEWLAKPCRRLDDQSPLDLAGNPVGFQVIENYLERIELGVYQ